MLSLLFSGMPKYGVAAVDYINNDVTNFLVFNNTVVGNTAVVENMNVINSAVITNNGVISGNIDVCNGCDVYIENRGSITASFDVPETSNIVQLVRGDYDINKIDAVDFDILIENADKVSWTGIQSISGGADKIILHNSGLVLDNAVVKLARMSYDLKIPEIELQGDITLYVNDMTEIPSGPLLSNISGDGIIRIEAENTNPLYRFYSYVIDNALFVDVVRDTDYFKIFNNNTGKFLNELRVTDPDNKLLSALDGAESFSELNDIISNSVRLNPGNLFDAIRFFDGFEINSFNTEINGIMVAPDFIYSDGASATGLRMGFGYRLNFGVNIGGYLYVSDLNFSDDYEEYKTALYGGNVHIAYLGDVLFSDVMAGTTIAQFDIGQVLYNDAVEENPTGLSFYSVADVGAKLNVDSDFAISPFVRVVFNKIRIINSDEDDIYYGAGVKFNFNSAGYDVSYKYGLNVVAYNDKQLFASAHIDFHSIADRAGAVFDIGALRTANGELGYKIQVGMNLLF